MADQSQIPEPTELIYLPSPSWAPAFTAAGLALILVGAFSGWVYALVGAIVLVRAVRFWFRDYEASAESLPRHQRVSTAVIPATRLRRSDRAAPPAADGK